MLISIKFKQSVSLKSITIHANATNRDDNDNDNDLSEPKETSIYKLKHLTVDFNDISLLSPAKSNACS